MANQSINFCPAFENQMMLSQQESRIAWLSCILLMDRLDSANSKKIEDMGKGMTVITARVSRLERNEMVVAHAHQALLQAFYQVSKKVIKNQKTTLVSMFRDLLATLVDEVCYDGDEVVQELELGATTDHGGSGHAAQSALRSRIESKEI